MLSRHPRPVSSHSTAEAAVHANPRRRLAVIVWLLLTCCVVAWVLEGGLERHRRWPHRNPVLSTPPEGFQSYPMPNGQFDRG